jgi:hypothetical protein
VYGQETAGVAGLRRRRRADDHAPGAVGAWLCDGDQLYWNSNLFWLAGAEGNDASNGIVRGDADGHAISGNDFDTESTHPTAELGEHLVTGVALNTVKASAVNGDDGALHVN